MAEVGGDTMAKKKKKGRPSLLDLQKRAIKQQHQQLQQQNRNTSHHQDNDDEEEDDDENHRSGSKNPNSLSSGGRSKRRNPYPNGVTSDSQRIKDDGDGVEGDKDERREKKLRLLHGLNSQSQSAGSDLNRDEAGDTHEASVNRRKFGGEAHGSEHKGEKASKGTHILQGCLVESGPTTPLPDKKLLMFILERLQKYVCFIVFLHSLITLVFWFGFLIDVVLQNTLRKDTYGVYSDPVDPEELPDYHERIANPMDFSTVRTKLDSGAYASLEQFESDVFLICTNAMEYNSADTVYYRQARTIHELAKKDFDNLRQESDDDEPPNQQKQQQQPEQPKVARRGRPPKKQPEPSSIDHNVSEISADGLIPGGDSSNRSYGAYNLRKTVPSYKLRQAETSFRMNHNSETQSSWSSTDWESEFPSSVVKAVNKYGMKHFNVDDNRRDTYNHVSTSAQEPTVLSTLEDELKQLIPVGLNTEYGYARSLARYAANLGPVAWKIASKRIKTVLPSGIKFGLGWVGENPAGPEEDESHKQILRMSLGKQKCSNELVSDDHSNRVLSPTASVSSAFIGNRHSYLQGIEEETTQPHARVLNPKTEYQSPSFPHQSQPLVNPESSEFRHNPSKQQPNLTNEVIHGSQPYKKQEFHRFPPDLNDRLVSPNSPGSNQQTGSSSSQHPDLALQL
ncbi:unnamed protein product [Cochlearia groenlandica]